MFVTCPLIGVCDISVFEVQPVRVEDVVAITPGEEDVYVESVEIECGAESSGAQRLSAAYDCAVVVVDDTVAINIPILRVSRPHGALSDFAKVWNAVLESGPELKSSYL